MREIYVVTQPWSADVYTADIPGTNVRANGKTRDDAIANLDLSLLPDSFAQLSANDLLDDCADGTMVGRIEICGK